MNETNIPLVSIRCITYNHEKYIRDTLEGFVMQKTNFKFEVIVHDDASTDNTPSIIREYAERYPDIIKPIFETENQYSKKDGSLDRIMITACKGKYVAFCEGDDYWTNPYKLQKQVDFMENHPECSLTYHACENLFETSNVHGLYGDTVKPSYTSITLLQSYFHTATIVVRNDVLKSDLYKKALATKCKSGDTMLCLTASRLGTLNGFNEKMSVYRRHDKGISFEMENPQNMYSNYKAWTAVSRLFGPEVKEWLEKHRLASYIIKSFRLKEISLFMKLMLYGIIHSPNSTKYAILQITKYCLDRISRIDFIHKR